VIRAPIAGIPQLNVIPQKAQVLVDVRTVPKQSHPDIRDELSAVAANVERKVREYYKVYDRRLNVGRPHGLKVDIEFLTDRPCTLTDINDPIVFAADWATRQVSAGEPVYAGVLGATDGTYLWALKDIPIVTMGAGEREVAHQVDEWVDLDQLIETAKIYALAAVQYLYPRGRL
jgi:succinyl-diaminopimelate desuccinylase